MSEELLRETWGLVADSALSILERAVMVNDSVLIGKAEGYLLGAMWKASNNE